MLHARGRILSRIGDAIMAIRTVREMDTATLHVYLVLITEELKRRNDIMISPAKPQVTPE